MTAPISSGAVSLVDRATVCPPSTTVTNRHSRPLRRSLSEVSAGSALHTALVSRWDGRWQVFVLDAVTGLVGTLDVESWDEVEPLVRAFLSRLHDLPAESFQLEVVHYGRRDLTPVTQEAPPPAVAPPRSRRGGMPRP